MRDIYIIPISCQNLCREFKTISLDRQEITHDPKTFSIGLTRNGNRQFYWLKTDCSLKLKHLNKLRTLHTYYTLTKQ